MRQVGRLRRLAAGATASLATVLSACFALPAGPVAAGPLPAGSGTVPAGGAGKGHVMCTVTDSRVIGLSGLIVTKTGYISISDSNIDKSKIRIWYLDKSCRPTRSVGYPTPAYDPEDVAIGRDGTLYVADIGDNDSRRTSIAVWRLAPGSSTPRIERYRYPDHAHDAEAILLDAHDVPIFVPRTRAWGRSSYRPHPPTRPAGRYR